MATNLFQYFGNLTELQAIYQQAAEDACDPADYRWAVERRDAATKEIGEICREVRARYDID